jgi:hypothetical protein
MGKHSADVHRNFLVVTADQKLAFSRKYTAAENLPDKIAPGDVRPGHPSSLLNDLLKL